MWFHHLLCSWRHGCLTSTPKQYLRSQFSGTLLQFGGSMAVLVGGLALSKLSSAETHFSVSYPFPPVSNFIIASHEPCLIRRHQTHESHLFDGVVAKAVPTFHTNVIPSASWKRHSIGSSFHKSCPGLNNDRQQLHRRYGNSNRMHPYLACSGYLWSSDSTYCSKYRYNRDDMSWTLKSPSLRCLHFHQSRVVAKLVLFLFINWSLAYPTSHELDAVKSAPMHHFFRSHNFWNALVLFVFVKDEAAKIVGNIKYGTPRRQSARFSIIEIDK